MTIQNLTNIVNNFLIEKNNYKTDIISIEKYFKKLVKSKDGIEKNVHIFHDGVSTDNSQNNMQQMAFNMSWKVVTGSIVRGSIDSRQQAITTACNLMKIQSDLISTETVEKFYFPSHMLQSILLHLLNENVDNSQIIKKFREYTKHNDVLYYCWEILPRIVNPKYANDIYVNNYLELLNVLPINSKGKIKDKALGFSEDDKPKILCEVEGGRRFHLNLKKVYKRMQECWNFVVVMKLNNVLLQKALLVLHDNLLPHLPQPVLLTDFLMNSMDVGGAISVLALQGVFVLMQKHNLEYPLVYNKLYSMYVPKMFNATHKSRLFYLTDIFLASTHLPETLVAGFIKKFSRLALVVTPADTIILLHMINNLIIRHPGLKKMVDSGETSFVELNEDPYNIDESNPSMSGAIQSSLWEVADLRNHIYPGVASAATLVLSLQKNKLEKPVTDFLDDTTDTLIQTELNRNYKQVFLNPKKPENVEFSDDGISQFWSYC